MKKTGRENYKNCEINWSVHGENNSYCTIAYVTIHADDIVDQQINGEVDVHNTLEEAENYIIDEAKKWIDKQIASGALKPIK